MIVEHKGTSIQVVARRETVKEKSPGTYRIPQRQAVFTVWGLGLDQGAAEEELTHMLDHLLGSHGVGDENRFMSEGNGINPAVEALGKELQTLYVDPANKLDEYSDKMPQEFLANWARAYLTWPDQNELRDLAPAVYNWLETKWFSNEYWRTVLR